MQTETEPIAVQQSTADLIDTARTNIWRAMEALERALTPTHAYPLTLPLLTVMGDIDAMRKAATR